MRQILEEIESALTGSRELTEKRGRHQGSGESRGALKRRKAALKVLEDTMRRLDDFGHARSDAARALDELSEFYQEDDAGGSKDISRRLQRLVGKIAAVELDEHETDWMRSLRKQWEKEDSFSRTDLQGMPKPERTGASRNRERADGRKKMPNKRDRKYALGKGPRTKHSDLGRRINDFDW